MRAIVTMLAALPLIALAAPAAAGDPPRGDGMMARHARREGRILPIREIERRLVPGMRDAQYLGFDLEMPSGVYTLKFLRDGNVIWVEVDGRSGQVIGRSGR